MRRRVSECVAANPSLARRLVAVMEGDNEVCDSGAWASALLLVWVVGEAPLFRELAGPACWSRRFSMAQRGGGEAGQPCLRCPKTCGSMPACKSNVDEVGGAPHVATDAGHCWPPPLVCRRGTWPQPTWSTYACCWA
jgi:hypothetical protein